MSAFTDTAAPPEVVEGPGRYVVYRSPDGGFALARATGICDTCRACGCGDQAEPVHVPAMLVKLAERHATGGGFSAVFGRVLGRGGRDGATG